MLGLLLQGSHDQSSAIHLFPPNMGLVLRSGNPTLSLNACGPKANFRAPSKEQILALDLAFILIELQFATRNPKET